MSGATAIDILPGKFVFFLFVKRVKIRLIFHVFSSLKQLELKCWKDLFGKSQQNKQSSFCICLQTVCYIVG